MGTNPRKSVVDPRGRVWGTDNLYVADASIFPSSSGVNPMSVLSSRMLSLSENHLLIFLLFSQDHHDVLRPRHQQLRA